MRNWSIASVVVAAALVLVMAMQLLRSSVPTISGQDKASLSVAQGLPLASDRLPIGSPLARESAELAWASLRPVAGATGALVVGAELVEYTAHGVGPARLDAEFSDGSIVVVRRPETLQGAFAIRAPGFALLDVTNLLELGGHHECVVEAAVEHMVEVVDGVGAPVCGVRLGVHRGTVRRVGENRKETVDAAAVVWPIEWRDNWATFSLSPGTYRFWLEESSIAIVSGDDPHIEGGVPTARRVTVGGLLACCLGVEGGPAQVRVNFPEGYQRVTGGALSGRLMELADRFPGTQVILATTASLEARNVARAFEAAMSVGGCVPATRSIVFSPLQDLSPQSISLAASRGSVHFRIVVMDPRGEHVDGITFFLSKADGEQSGAVVPCVSGTWIDAAPGTYRPNVTLKSVVFDGLGDISINGGSTMEVVLRVNRTLAVVDMMVQFEDGSAPQYVIIKARGDGWSQRFSSRRPEKVRMHVPVGQAEFDVLIPDVGQATVRAQIEAGKGNVNNLVATVPRRG